MTENTYLEEFDKSRIVYLTSDSDNVLGELSKDDVYIIGGLVDHNRYKGMCLKNAEDEGIRTARLPIHENVKMKTRDVLTIEQGVFRFMALYSSFSFIAQYTCSFVFTFNALHFCPP